MKLVANSNEVNGFNTEIDCRQALEIVENMEEK